MLKDTQQFGLVGAQTPQYRIKRCIVSFSGGQPLKTPRQQNSLHVIRGLLIRFQVSIAVPELLTDRVKHGLLLLVHGEVTRPDVDVFDREARFLDEVLAPLVAAHPRLKVVLEHVTTRQGVDFVCGAGARVGGTLTVSGSLVQIN